MADPLKDYQQMLQSMDVARLPLPDGDRFSSPLVRGFQNDANDADALLDQPFDKETPFEEIDLLLKGDSLR